MKSRAVTGWFVAAVLLPGAAAPLAAQGNGTTGAILLEMPATARAVGLGGAYTSVVGDEGSVFANPAGMAPIHHLALGGSFERSALGITYTSAAAVLRVGRLDFGAGLALLDYGGDSVLTPDPLNPDVGLPTGRTIVAYQALGVGAVAYRRGMLSVGASVKALREHIGTGDPTGYTAHGVTGDVGFAVAVFDIMSIGAVFQNVGGRLASDSGPVRLPKTTRLGFTLNFIDPQGTARFMTTTDYVVPTSGDNYWAIGLEGGVVSGGMGIMARLGVRAGAAASDRSGLVYGGTVRFHGLNIDWGYQSYSALGGATQRLGARWII